MSCIDPSGLWGITIGIGIGGYFGGGGIGIGSPRGGSITFGNTGTIGIIGTGDGRPVSTITNVCR